MANEVKQQTLEVKKPSILANPILRNAGIVVVALIIYGIVAGACGGGSLPNCK